MGGESSVGKVRLNNVYIYRIYICVSVPRFCRSSTAGSEENSSSDYESDWEREVTARHGACADYNFSFFLQLIIMYIQ